MGYRKISEENSTRDYCRLRKRNSAKSKLGDGGSMELETGIKVIPAEE